MALPTTMDALLNVITHRTVNLAINSGMIISAKYTWNQGCRLAKNVDPEQATELLSLHRLLKSKMQVISPSIDMIDLIAARGNTSLETAVSLTKEIRCDVQSLGQRLEKAALFAESIQKGEKAPKQQSMKRREVELVIKDTKKLLGRIEEVVPLLNLAITTSGAQLSTNLPSTVSPSRLLQSSTFLTSGDTQYCMLPFQPVQIGPTFTLSMYMLFSSHLRPHDQKGVRETTWKEVMHKARLKLRRVPVELTLDPENQERRRQFPPVPRSDEYAYQMLVIEDLDDGRVHDFEDNELRPQSYEGVNAAGIREILPVHQISKIFYADTGKILNMNVEEETNNPVLLLKRDINAIPPRRMVERDDIELFLQEKESQNSEGEEDEVQAQIDAQLNESNAQTNSNLPPLHENSIPEGWRLPKDLDPDWIAFEVYNEDEVLDTESDEEGISESPPAVDNVDPQLMAKLSLEPQSCLPSPSPSQRRATQPTSSSQHFATTTVSNPLFNKIRTSLSLLEMLLRLTSLQQFQQQSHLSISDELLNFFLEEASSTGAGGDEQHRQRLRSDARRKVGWDPYDESPVKRRGEDYQHSHVSAGSPAGFARDRNEYLSSPSDRARSFQIRSRESTPESPLSRPSSSVRPGGRRAHPLRGSPAYAAETPKSGTQSTSRSTPVQTDEESDSKY